MIVTLQNVRWKAVRASGPGGQRVNRRSTKVQMWAKVADLPFTEVEKRRIRQGLLHRINHKDELEVVCEEERSQELNCDKALRHMNALIEEALKVPEPRIPTKPPRSFENVRIAEKKIVSEKKQSRREGGNKQ